MVFITFCDSRVSDDETCYKLNNYNVATTYYVIIDTLAESTFGLPLAEPDTLWYLPEPFPRITLVEGFQFQAAASYELVDSLPENITLGDKVSPSVAMITGNALKLHYKGDLTEASLANGIVCFEEDEPLTCEYKLSDEYTFLQSPVETGYYYAAVQYYIEVKFPDLFKSSTNYKVVLDSQLVFTGGYTFPLTQTISWKTLAFTIDTAQFFGRYNPDDTIALLQTKYHSWSNLYPNLEPTTFFTSTLPDSATIAENILIDPDYPRGDLIVEDNKFGWETKSWLPPGTDFTFTLLPGLSSQAGDSLGDTLQYKVTTEPFDIVHYNFFGLSPQYMDGIYVDPPQDSIYDLPIGTLDLKYGKYFEYNIPAVHSAYINLSAPVDSVVLAENFSVNPDLDFIYAYNGTGLAFFNDSALISDTIYNIVLEPEVIDTFGNTLGQSFHYQFKTESFELKVGNLFGVYFGPVFENLSTLLPNQPLPEIETIEQGVYLPVSLTWLDPDDPADAQLLTRLMADTLLGIHSSFLVLPSKIYFSDADNPVFFKSQIIYNYVIQQIGMNVSMYQPGFSDTANYLCFSHYPDSTLMHDYIEITPDDGSIHLRLEGNKLRFSTSNYAHPNTDYRIKIKQGLPDVHGRALKDSIVVAFTTPPFTLLNAGINNLTLFRDSILINGDFGLQSTINFLFNARFTHPLSFSNLKENFTSSPHISGILRLNLEQLLLVPSRALIPDTSYTLTIGSGIQEQNGIQLDTSYTITFQTEKFKLYDTSIGDTAYPELFGVQTNSILDSSTIASYINISPQRYSSGTFDLSEDSTGFYFTPDSIPLLGNKITVAIDPLLEDIYGHQLDSADTIVFYWMEQFQLEYLFTGSVWDGSLFSAHTNYKLDTLSLPAAVQITPPRYESGIFELSSDSTGFFYIPDSSLIFGDQVTIIVDTDLADIYGNHLEEPDSLEFIINTTVYR
jgi:hypothetical protein